jgi:hypothetical protein
MLPLLILLALSSQQAPRSPEQRDSLHSFRNTVLLRFIVGNPRLQFLGPEKNLSSEREFEKEQRRVRTLQAITRSWSGAAEPGLATSS